MRVNQGRIDLMSSTLPLCSREPQELKQKLPSSMSLFWPVHEILVLIENAGSVCSDESAHPHSLVRAFTVNTHKIGTNIFKMPRPKNPTDICPFMFKEWF